MYLHSSGLVRSQRRILRRCRCTDAKTMVNKAEVATYYTNNYSSYDKAEAAKAVANVDSTDASVVAAKAYVDGL